ncbi:MAG: hypothetical protein HZA49_08100 [Planctomycetes bacterium]|nr:hypothetical protein [Planctomycetota bacterium]
MKKILLLAGLLLLAGCAVNASGPQDAKAIVLNAHRMLDEAKGYRFNMDVTLDDTPATINIKGAIQNPDFCYFKVTLSTPENAEAEVMEVYRQGNKLALNHARDGEPKEWQPDDYDDPEYRSVATDMLWEVYKTVDVDKLLRNAKSAGTMTVNGIECYKIEALFDAEDLKDFNAIDEGRMCPPGTGKAVKAGYRFWVAKGSGELCKTQRTIEYPASDKAMTLDITMMLSDHHKDIKLEIPAEVQALLKDNPETK